MRGIQVKLKELLEERQVTRGYVARMVQTRFEVIDRWYEGSLERIDLDVLARICRVLSCEVQDILEVAKEREEETDGGR